jgi:hypothetical protein
MLPLTIEECRKLADDILEGRRSLVDVRAALDVDEWFAACSTDELCQEDVEIVVRWALREHLAHEFRDLFRDLQPDGSEFPAFRDFIYNGTASRTSGSERSRAVAATKRLLDELGAINRQDRLGE